MIQLVGILWVQASVVESACNTRARGLTQNLLFFNDNKVSVCDQFSFRLAMSLNLIQLIIRSI